MRGDDSVGGTPGWREPSSAEAFFAAGLFKIEPRLSMARLHVVLVTPEIPWNTGNVGRTCLGVDADLHLIAPLGFSLEDRQVRRAGLDYWPRVRVTLWPDWATFAAELPRLGSACFFSTRAARRYFEVEYPNPAVLIFGRESVGLPPAILEAHAASTVSIPMLDPELRSLNLSTSVAIAAYEVRRQWAARGTR
jgi:tRNA (cytidine/uridine-2'-O-)-methyltransferase